MTPFLIPIVAIIFGLSFAAFCCYLAFQRSRLRHEERMKAIEQGVEIPVLPKDEEITPAEFRLRDLRRGLIWAVVGVGIFLLFWGIAEAEGDPEVKAIAWAFGFIPTGIGLVYIVMYIIRSRQAGKDELPPPTMNRGTQS